MNNDIIKTVELFLHIEYVLLIVLSIGVILSVLLLWAVDVEIKNMKGGVE